MEYYYHIGGTDRINEERGMGMNVSNIRKAVVNGRNVKIFDVRKEVDGAMVFVGTFTAPAKTANRDLLNHIETN